MAHKGDPIPFFVAGIARSGMTVSSLDPQRAFLHLDRPRHKGRASLDPGIDASSLSRWSDRVGAEIDVVEHDSEDV
ncbi:MAG: hypothetical protein ABFR53_10900, partial [Actinomycetota bacterium]